METSPSSAPSTAARNHPSRPLACGLVVGMGTGRQSLLSYIKSFTQQGPVVNAARNESLFPAGCRLPVAWGPSRPYAGASEAAMAQRSKSHPDNVPGSFFVDRTCIDCGTCYEYLPWVFQEADGHSRVYRQPAGPSDHVHALKALLACPTGSIGTDAKAGLKEAAGGLPRPHRGGGFLLRLHLRKEFRRLELFHPAAGGQRPGGFAPGRAGPAGPPGALGGVALMVLSHQDDVADHARFHERFHCRRVLHRADLGEATAEWSSPWTGTSRSPGPGPALLPTPGHTAGSACLLYREQVPVQRRPPVVEPPAGHAVRFASLLLAPLAHPA